MVAVELDVCGNPGTMARVLLVWQKEAFLMILRVTHRHTRMRSVRRIPQYGPL